MNVLASRGQLRASFIRWALFTVPLVVFLGFVSGQVAGSSADNPWFAALVKPSIYPPPAAFGIVWTILYVMMGLALALICSAWGARGRGMAITAFVLQLLLNLAWAPLFFAAYEIKGALMLIVVLDLLVILTVILFWRIRRLAGLLLLPYLAWILFATLLNYEFLRLNPDAADASGSSAVQRIAI